jgi:hypothetical protein
MWADRRTVIFLSPMTLRRNAAASPNRSPQ